MLGIFTIIKLEGIAVVADAYAVNSNGELC